MHPPLVHPRFALLRDDGVAGNLLEVAATPGDPLKQQHSAPINVTSFKGRGHGCEVAGLTPNTLYHFRVRAVNNRTRSSLSAPLAVGVSSLHWNNRVTHIILRFSNEIFLSERWQSVVILPPHDGDYLQLLNRMVSV